MNLPDLHKKYMAGVALTNAELKFFHSKLSKLVELLFNMDMEQEPMFIRLNQALKDAYHMMKARGLTR